MKSAIPLNCSNSATYLKFEAQSAPIHLPVTDAAEAGDATPPYRLPLFSAAAHRFEAAAAQQGGGSAKKRRRMGSASRSGAGGGAGSGAGAVLHVGGPVWALDWSPPLPTLQPGDGSGGIDDSGGAGSAGQATTSQFLAVRRRALQVLSRCIVCGLDAGKATQIT